MTEEKDSTKHDGFPGEKYAPVIIGLAPRIRKKIKTCRLADFRAYRTYKLTDYIDIEWTKQALHKAKYKCALCGVKLELVDSSTMTQFSIDRLNNRIAHVKNNCQITCLKCNKAKS